MFYNRLMLNNKEKLGAFIVPTGIGASIGGYAGDASFWAREFSKKAKLIVNPNVVNAGGFSGINDNMFYIEGYSLDEFFKGNLNFIPSSHKKVGIVIDCAISETVRNIHINTINAVKTVYGIDCIYEFTKNPVRVEFFLDDSGISVGKINAIEEVLKTSKSLIEKGAEAIAIVCLFSDEELNEEYENGIGVDPVGGVEAIISHYISKELQIPAAHSPAFEDYEVATNIVNPKAASECITPTFLPCILLGLNQAPLLTTENSDGAISIDNLDFLIMPYNALGSTPVFEALKRETKVYAVKENSTVLNITKDTLKLDGIIEVEDYKTCLELI